MPQQQLHGDNYTLPSVLIIGTDGHVLVEGSEHRARMLRYASAMRELHIVVLGAQGVSEARVQIGDHVFAYPTHSTSRAHALIEGLCIGMRIIAGHTIDIISTQDPFECALIGYLLKRRSNACLQIQEHGDFFSLSHWRRERLLHQVRYVVGLWLIRRADHIRAVSARIKRGLVARGIKSECVVTVPVQTDVAAFRSAAPAERIMKLRPEGGVLILTMARMVPQKNLTLLIDAFREVIQSGTRAHLVILGKGPEKEVLRARAHGLVPEHLTFLEWTDDPAGAMRAADIYALSSNYEGWGRVCIEALAAGIPLVMTDVGCAGEVVHDGKNGLVVPVGDVHAFAQALTRLATDQALRERLTRCGVETVDRLPTSEDYIAAYKKSLECCIVPSHEGS